VRALFAIGSVSTASSSTLARATPVNDCTHALLTWLSPIGLFACQPCRCVSRCWPLSNQSWPRTGITCSSEAMMLM
jgi:hypothetical protein